MFVTSIFLAVLAILAFASSLLFPDAMKKWPKITGGMLAGIAFLCLAISSFAQVAPSHIGIVTTFGKIDPEQRSEGGHFIWPVSRMHQVFVGVDVAAVTKADAGSKDTQSVFSDLTVNYSVKPGKALDLFVMNPSLNYEVAYVTPALLDVFKAIASQYTAEELVTKRVILGEQLLAALNNKLRSYHLEARTINLTNFKFSASFNAAIEEKVTASQKAETAKRQLETAKFTADARVAQAEGEAKAIAIQAAAIEKQGGVGYVQLQAISKWDGKLPQQMLGSAPVPFVNVK